MSVCASLNVHLARFPCLYEHARLHHSPSGSMSHAEQRGNEQPSGLRHLAVTDPSKWLWEAVRSHCRRRCGPVYLWSMFILCLPRYRCGLQKNFKFPGKQPAHTNTSSSTRGQDMMFKLQCDDIMSGYHPSQSTRFPPGCWLLDGNISELRTHVVGC